jgi:hypothetical protein
MRLRTMLAMIAATLVCRGAFGMADRDGLASGLALLDEAARMRLAEPTRASHLASDAAVLIGSALDGGSAMNPAGQRALGNAYLLSGDIGRAVLAFKRAESADPGDPLVRASLEHARSRVGLEFGPSAGTTGWRSVVNHWSGGVPRGIVFYGCVGVLALACWTLALRVLSVVPRWVVVPAGVALVVSACGLGLVLVEPLVVRSDAAVVISETTGRTGPHAEVYPTALDRPVPAGAEVRVLEARDGWFLCAVGGQQAWLAGEAVRRVRPIDQDGTTGG